MQVSSTHQWTTCTSWVSTALLARTWQLVYLGTHPNIQRTSWLSQPWNGHNPRLATQAQLPLHLSILPSQKRHSQEACLEHQRPIRLGHTMASCKTQVHSTAGSSNLVVHTVPKPSGTLDHHSRSRVKYKGPVRTNQNATSQWWRTYPCYALRRLANNIQEPFCTLSLNAIDASIKWWNWKPAPHATALRAPWSLLQTSN